MGFSFTREWCISVALTGNIGSGKSTVAELWAGAGVPVISADELAREAVVTGSGKIHGRPVFVFSEDFLELSIHKTSSSSSSSSDNKIGCFLVFFVFSAASMTSTMVKSSSLPMMRKSHWQW